MKSFRDIRVIPVVLVAIFALAVLKVAGLVIDGGYVFDYQPQSTQRSWAQGTFNFPSGNKFDPADVTGSTHEKPKEEAPKTPAAAPEVAKPDGVVVYPEQTQPISASERAILERLQSRRQELDARAREIDIRESLLKAAEKRIESRVEELKAVEARIATATGQKNDADAARFKGIITMYEGMKPKDAAKVFDRLAMSVLFEIASQLAEAKWSGFRESIMPKGPKSRSKSLAPLKGKKICAPVRRVKSP